MTRTTKWQTDGEGVIYGRVLVEGCAKIWLFTSVYLGRWSRNQSKHTTLALAMHGFKISTFLEHRLKHVARRKPEVTIVLYIYIYMYVLYNVCIMLFILQYNNIIWNIQHFTYRIIEFWRNHKSHLINFRFWLVRILI